MCMKFIMCSITKQLINELFTFLKPRNCLHINVIREPHKNTNDLISYTNCDRLTTFASKDHGAYSAIECHICKQHS